MSLSNLDDLAGRIDASVQAALTERLRLARALANESRINGARQAVNDAVTTILPAAYETKREADEKVRDAKAEHSAAVAEAEWMLGGFFVARSNKQWLAIDADGVAVPEEDQRSLTADEKAKWIATTAADNEEVRRCAKALRSAEGAADQALIDLELAKKRTQAAFAELTAAVTYLSVIAGVVREESA